MDILKDLAYRGLIYQQTDENGLEKLLKEKKVALYCGVDPTGDSMHVGHLLPFLVLRRFLQYGNTPIIVIGGATGSIGDPSGKKQERQLQSLEVINYNVKCLTSQLNKIFKVDKESKAIFLNNYEWTSNKNILEFLRDFGKNFNINQMLSKDTVATRLETGISFTEFSYQILQAMDFHYLYKTYNCVLQIGGSDQWGNIVSGLDLIRKKEGEGSKAFGLTLPLITKSDGTKFGKTEDGAIWLDEKKTSPYEFYQFWINVDDKDVITYLKYFTFLSHEEIENLSKKTKESPENREAQKALAADITKLVHGEEPLIQAINISKSLFKGDIATLSINEIEMGLKNVPSYELKESEISLIDLLVSAKISSSKRQAREDINSGAIYINDQKIQSIDKIITYEDRIKGKYIIIRRGKKKYYLIRYIK